MGLVRTVTQIIDALFKEAVDSGLLESTTFRRGRFGLLFSAFASELTHWQNNVIGVTNEHYLDSATETINIERLGAPLRYRSPATPSRTTLMFRWHPLGQQPDNYIIPANQIVETEELNPIQYVTTKEAVLYQGQSYVLVPAMSRKNGANTHVPVNKLIRLDPGIGAMEVSNIEESWGGKNQETIDAYRRNVFSVRNHLERGTEYAIKSLLLELGLETYEYNLVEYYFGRGSFKIYVDIASDEFLNVITAALKRYKSEGIYCECEMADEHDLNFHVIINLAQEQDLVPRERDEIIKIVERKLRRYVLYNGVGKLIDAKKIKHYILDDATGGIDLLQEYSIYDIQIKNLVYPEPKEELDDILIMSNEVPRVRDVTVEIKTEVR